MQGEQKRSSRVEDLCSDSMVTRRPDLILMVNTVSRASAGWPNSTCTLGTFQNFGRLSPNLVPMVGSSECLPLGSQNRVIPGSGPSKAHEPGRGIIDTVSQR